MIHLSLSVLSHTWLIDIDGTILKHNGHLESGEQLLGGVREFWQKIPLDDTIILLTAREDFYANQTIEFLRINNIRYDKIIFNIPQGERILINDIKPTGLITAHAVNILRDVGLAELSFTREK